LSSRLSPDGMYYWDGQAWVSTLSPDGRHRWNGQAWEPLAATAYAPTAGVAREPTSWTRPLQYAVVAWYGISALFTATLPFWMGSAMNQVMNQVIQRQEATSVEPPPPGFADAMSSMMTGVFWVSAIIGVAIAVVAIVAAIRRWTWAYYAILVLLGLGLLGLPINLVNAASGGSLNTMQGYSLPMWSLWFSIGAGLVSGALFVWMLVALVRFGPWAMKRVS
jgi:hypothetical protein